MMVPMDANTNERHGHGHERGAYGRCERWYAVGWVCHDTDTKTGGYNVLADYGGGGDGGGGGVRFVVAICGRFVGRGADVRDGGDAMNVADVVYMTNERDTVTPTNVHRTAVCAWCGCDTVSIRRRCVECNERATVCAGCEQCERCAFYAAAPPNGGRDAARWWLMVNAYAHRHGVTVVETYVSTGGYQRALLSDGVRVWMRDERVARDAPRRWCGGWRRADGRGMNVSRTRCGRCGECAAPVWRGGGGDTGTTPGGVV